MKFGILMHKNTQNIGDDIQSFAAANLLPSVDYFLDRETLDTFKTEDGKPVATVMSAWYMWSKWNWPPSKYIVPLYVGMHWADHQIAQQDGSPIKTEFLTGIGGEYLNAYGPIGCRDMFTYNTFKRIGINSYFSGCITLTLPKMPVVKKEREYICVCDLPAPVVNRIKKLMKNTGIDVVETTHYKDYRNSTASWEERVEAVKELLTIYQNAKCVVTRRLHCALPCLAMEVPVLLATKNAPPVSGRFDPYWDWLHHCSYQQFLKGEYEYDFTNPPENSGEYVEYRNALIKSVKDFVEKYKDADGSCDDFNRLKYTDDEIMKWRHDTMKSVMYDWLMYTRNDFHTIKKLNAQLEKSNARFKKDHAEVSKEINTLKSKIKTLKAEKSELEAEKLKLESEKSQLENKKTELEAANSRYVKILNCRPVKTTIKLRNAFVNDNKKIKL